MSATMEAPATIRARKSVMWTHEDCRRLEGMCMLPERWELVQGEIISKIGTNLPDSKVAKRIDVWLSSVFPTDRILPTCSIDLAPEDTPTSEPEPDITVLNVPADELTRNPFPSDIDLVVEVSDTTLDDHDRRSKAKFCARAGIPEYWVIDTKGRSIQQHRQPHAGTYTQICTLDADDPPSMNLSY